MKRGMVFVAAMIFSGIVFCQPGNPQDKSGSDFARSVRYLVGEVSAGNIKSYDAATLEALSNRVPLANKVNVDLFNEVYKRLTDHAFDAELYIRNSNLPTEKKLFFLELNQKAKSVAVDAFNRYLIDKAATLSRDKGDQKDALAYLSFLYHLPEATPAATRHSPTESTSQTYECTQYPAACGAIVGMVAGSFICGPVCAFGGAIIGAVIGSFFDHSK